MKTKRLLVTGISGFLGWFVAKRIQNDWEIVGVYNKNKPTFDDIELVQFDLNNQFQINQLLAEKSIDGILHLAALSNANFCEQNEIASHQINLQLTSHLAVMALMRKIPFLFTSTDLVFDGTNPPYKEDSPISPISRYGQHKALAEQMVLETNPNACIARMPLMYGTPDNGKGFMNAWIRNLKEGKTIGAFTDEYRTAVDGITAARGLFLLLEKGVKGIWHLGGKERLSRYEFAIRMAKENNLDASLINPVLQKDIKMAAARPADVSLDSSKAFQIGY